MRHAPSTATPPHLSRRDGPRDETELFQVLSLLRSSTVSPTTPIPGFALMRGFPLTFSAAAAAALARGSAHGVLALMESAVAEVKPASVVVALKDKTKKALPNDVIYCLLGANPPTDWLAKMGIEITQKPSDWDPGRTDRLAFMHFEGGDGA